MGWQGKPSSPVDADRRRFEAALRDIVALHPRSEGACGRCRDVTWPCRTAEVAIRALGEP